MKGGAKRRRDLKVAPLHIGVVLDGMAEAMPLPFVLS